MINTKTVSFDRLCKVLDIYEELKVNEPVENNIMLISWFKRRDINLTYLNRGSYSRVFKYENYVLKFLISTDFKFHTEYPDVYLKPLYISKNRRFCVQSLAKTDNYTKNEEELINFVSMNFIINNIKCKHRYFLDIKYSNLGIYNDKVFIIDLDNQFNSNSIKKSF